MNDINEPKASPPYRISDKMRAKLVADWDDCSHKLMDRDGTNAGFAGGGHNVKHNPLLRAAILEIRDEYWERMQEILYWRMPENIGTLAHERDTQCYYAMIDITSRAFKRLQAPNYGFSPSRCEQILKDAGPDSVNTGPFDKAEAKNIIGSIIRHTIDSFDRVTKQHVKVPHSLRPNLLQSLHDIGMLSRQTILLSHHLEEQKIHSFSARRIIELGKELKQLCQPIPERALRELKAEPDDEVGQIMERHAFDNTVAPPLIDTLRQVLPYIRRLASEENAQQRYSYGQNSDDQVDAAGLANAIAIMLKTEKSLRNAKRMTGIYERPAREPFKGLGF